MHTICLLIDQIRVYPRKVTVPKGEFLNFTCISMYAVSWFNSRTDTLVAIGPMLTLKVESLLNTKYECASRDRNGDIFRAMVEIDIIGIIFLLIITNETLNNVQLE